MSTTLQPLKYLWTAYFDGGNFIEQPPDDRYSKHVEDAEHNPSAFRDILDLEKSEKLYSFKLEDSYGDHYWLCLEDGSFIANNGGKSSAFCLEQTPLTDRKLIYFREVKMEFIDGVQQEPYVNRYCFGYEGKNLNGEVEKKVLYING